MKKIIFAATAALFASSAVQAADLIIPTTPQPIMSHTSVFDWSGFYAGVNAGYGWASVETGGVTFDDGEGIFGGLQVGYNHDFGGFVLGAEADFQLSDISYEETAGGVTARTAIDNFGTVRARAGFAVDRFMPYVTGGFAWANASVSLSGGGASVSIDDTYAGWTAGAGVEYALMDNVSIKAEYLYLDFGAADFGTGTDLNLTSHVARAGVNFQF